MNGDLGRTFLIRGRGKSEGGRGKTGARAPSVLEGNNGAVNAERPWAGGDCQWTREHLQQREPEVDATPPQHQDHRKVRKRDMDQCRCSSSPRPQRDECCAGESGGRRARTVQRCAKRGAQPVLPSQVVDPPTACSSMGVV